MLQLSHARQVAAYYKEHNQTKEIKTGPNLFIPDHKPLVCYHTMTTSYPHHVICRANKHIVLNNLYMAEGWARVSKRDISRSLSDNKTEDDNR